MEKEFPRLVWVQVCYGKRDPQTSMGSKSLWEKRSSDQYGPKIAMGKEIPRLVWVQDRYGKRDPQTSMKKKEKI